MWTALRHWSDLTAERIALSGNGRVLNYRALAAQSELRASWLAERGVVAGDRVLIVGLNSVDWVVAYLATLRLSAMVVPANSRLSAAQMADLVGLLEPRIILTDERHRCLFADVEIEPEDLESPLPVSIAKLPDLPRGEVPALISFTSGTTGQPKGAVLSLDALTEASATFQRYFATGPQDSTVIVAPMFHNTGFVDQFGHMLLAGGRADLLREFHRKEAVAAFRSTPASFVTAVPSVLRMLMLEEGAQAVFGAARIVLFGGAPMPAAWSRELLERWPHLQLFHGYGLTEFGSACSFLPPELVRFDGESVGYAAPRVEIRIVDETGADVAPGEVGELWVAGPTRMSGYWRRPDATAEKLDGKWLRTGDLGHLGKRGLLFLDGRRDDMINRAGEKILPAYLESILSERPDVATCVVVGIPDAVLQEVPAAAIEERPGYHFDATAARELMAGRLPGYAIPSHFLTFDRLPRIASGKVDRRAVRTTLIARLNEQSVLSGDCR